jgi:hypothetical protein
MKVYQDGNTFYNDETGEVVFISSIVVKDFDMEASKLARKQFLEWVERTNIDIELV